MIETTLTLSPNTATTQLPQNLSVTRIKTYTRKLAEIERFIEHYVDAPLPTEPQVTIHTYWTAA